MYMVVEFVQERELSIVPEAWTVSNEDDGVCSQWPSHMFPLTLKRAITKMESPDPCWPVYNIRVLYTTGSYRKAEEILNVLDMYTDPDLKGKCVTKQRKCNKRNQTDSSSQMPDCLNNICTVSRSPTETRLSPESNLPPESMLSPCPVPSSNPSGHRRFLPAPPVVNGGVIPKRMLPSPVNFVKVQPNSIDTTQCTRVVSDNDVKLKRLPSPVQMETRIHPDILRSMTCPKTIRQIPTLSTTLPKTALKDDVTNEMSLESVIAELRKTLKEQTGLISNLAEIVQEPQRDTSPQLPNFTSHMISRQRFQECDTVLQETIPKRFNMCDWQSQHGTREDEHRN